MKIIEVFSSLEQMIRRLNAMSSNEQMPEDAKNQLLKEIDVLDYLRSDLMSNMTKIAIVIGHSQYLASYLSELAHIPSHRATNAKGKEYIKTISSDDLTISTIVSPTDKVFQKFCDLYDQENFDGSNFHSDSVLDYVICNRYYIATDVIMKKKAILFNLSIRTKYISNIGECVDWTKAIFSQECTDPDLR